MSIFELKIEATGSRKQLSNALKLLANSIFSENLEEVYNIDGAEYNNCILVVKKFKDLEE